MFFNTEYAIAKPSNVEVPRPSSSMIANDLFVACVRMFFVYYI